MKSRGTNIVAALMSASVISPALSVVQEPADKPHIVARRLPNNPIISPATDSSIGTNINGPSLVRVPKWVDKPLGAYYLYFADHNGKTIRLATSDRLEGPWKVYAPGALALKDSYFTDHIASPDVVIDDARKEFRLYYHGLTPEERSQHTRVAISHDGVTFRAVKEPVGRGSAYWRVFRHDGWWVALAMPGKLFRSRDGLSPFEPGPQLFPRMPMQVHNAVLARNGKMTVFYTRAGDTPEQILASEVDLSGDWETWKPSPPTEVLKPAEMWEGADRPLTPATVGAVNERIRALRDPAIYSEEGRTYLLYAIAGESGIGIAELRFPTK